MSLGIDALGVGWGTEAVWAEHRGRGGSQNKEKALEDFYLSVEVFTSASALTGDTMNQ